MLRKGKKKQKIIVIEDKKHRLLQLFGFGKPADKQKEYISWKNKQEKEIRKEIHIKRREELKRKLLHTLGFYKTPEEIEENAKNKKQKMAAKVHKEKAKLYKHWLKEEQIHKQKEERRKKIKQVLHAFGLYRTADEKAELKKLKHLKQTSNAEQKLHKERTKQQAASKRQQEKTRKKAYKEYLKQKKLKDKYDQRTENIKIILRILGFKTPEERAEIKRLKHQKELIKQQQNIKDVKETELELSICNDTNLIINLLKNNEIRQAKEVYKIALEKYKQLTPERRALIYGVLSETYTALAKRTYSNKHRMEYELNNRIKSLTNTMKEYEKNLK